MRDPAELRAELERFGFWYHNIDLGDGVFTHPDHPRGDYPASRFEHLRPFVPADLTGKSVLDIGCASGYFAIEMKRRGAGRVLGIDLREWALEQGRFAAGHLGLEIEFRNMDAYDIGGLGEDFDVVIFLGVLYHLRHPLLMLDLIRAHCRETMLFQTILYRGAQPLEVPSNLEGPQVDELFRQAGYPKLYFVEDRFEGDPTNTWIIGRNAMLAMLRSAGFVGVNETSSPDTFVVYTDDGPPGAEPLAGLELRSRHAEPTGGVAHARELMGRVARRIRPSRT
jgi:tRNA (mo5U34)-methyltransferase